MKATLTSSRSGDVDQLVKEVGTTQIRLQPVALGAAGWSSVFGANPLRECLIFCQDRTNDYSVSPDGPPPTADGMIVRTGQQPLRICQGEFPGLPQRAWFGQNLGVATNGLAIEIVRVA